MLRFGVFFQTSTFLVTTRPAKFSVESIFPRAPFLQSSLRTAVSRALEHPKVSAPRAHDLSILVGHKP